MRSVKPQALVRRPDRRAGLVERLGRAAQQRLADWTFEQTGPELEERLRKLPWDQLNELGLDPYGLDPDVVVSGVAPFVWLYKHYFRVEVAGAEQLPEGRVMLVANHSGQIPIDGAMVGLAAFLEPDPPRLIRAMFEKWVPRLPWVNVFFARMGQVVGTPENARRLLEQGECLLVFPEGVRGISKPISKRYQLQEFGLGFMRLALETGTPIVPVSVVGAEEQIISLANLESAGRLLGLPSLPVVPQALVPVLGWLPLPTKYRITFGEPMTFEGSPDEEDAAIAEKVHTVRGRLQQMLYQGLKARRSIFF